MTLARFKTLAEVIALCAGVVGLLSGGLFAAYQHLQARDRDRVQTTLAYVAAFRSDPLLAKRTTILQAWLDEERSGALAIGISDVAKAESYLKNVIVSKLLDDEITAVLEFYSEVRVCMAHQVCDEVTAGEFFGCDAKVFRNLHWGFIEEHRNHRDAAFVSGVEYVAKHCTKSA